MNVKMSRKWLLSLSVTLGMVILLWVISTAVAEGPEGGVRSQGDVSITATVNSRISYQGVLKENGTPVNGHRDMIFRLYSDDTCTFQVGYNIVKNGVPVTDGLFSVELDVDQLAFNGQGLWLQVEVNGTYIGCEEVLPVPYALSLRPGAVIEGEPTGWEGWVLRANMTGAYPLGKAVWGSTATGSAVLGESTGGYGLRGYSENGNAVFAESVEKTAGVFNSNEGYGIQVSTNGTDHWDHAGYFTSNWGHGIYVTSAHSNALRAVGGDDLSGVWQPGGTVGVAGLSGTNVGVFGSSRESNGVYGVSQNSSGVYGETESEDYTATAGVWGQKWSGAGTAVRGLKYGTYGIAVYGTNAGDTGSGVVGESTNWFGVWGETAQADNNYGLYTPDNLYSLNYHMSGAVMHVAQNGGSETLQPGDVVVFSGMTAPLEAGGPPIVQVARATSANSTAVAGVVYNRLDIKAVTGKWQADGQDAAAGLGVTIEGPVPPAGYLLLVVQGLAQVKASAVAGPIRPGDLLSSAGQVGYASKTAEVSIEGLRMAVPGTVFGKALEPLDKGQRLIYVFVTLQ